MRHRTQILDSLERVYRDAFEQATSQEDGEEQARLDFDFQRDQIHLEVLLDIRDLLSSVPATDSSEGGTAEKVGGLLDTAQKLKNLTRLR